MIGNPIFSNLLEPKVIATIKKKREGNTIITQIGSVDFKGVLPFIHCNQENESEYLDVHNKIISGKVLSRIPMSPMSLYGGDRVGLKYLVDLLCSELEK